MVIILSSYFAKHLWCTFTEFGMKQSFTFFKLIKSRVTSKYKTLSGRGERYYKKHFKPYMANLGQMPVGQKSALHGIAC